MYCSVIFSIISIVLLSNLYLCNSITETIIYYIVGAVAGGVILVVIVIIVVLIVAYCVKERRKTMGKMSKSLVMIACYS